MLLLLDRTCARVPDVGRKKGGEGWDCDHLTRSLFDNAPHLYFGF